jgi:cytochrome c oxidase cbb3-type subunit 2
MSRAKLYRGLRCARHAGSILTASVTLLLSFACDRPGSGLPSGPAGSVAVAVASTPESLSPAARRARADKAEALFKVECASCHGERGRGDGPAAAAIAVRPRNFLTEKFKVRTTESGNAPTRGDILATITRGMPGSAMPSFAFLTDDERNLLADHVWSLAGLDAKKPGKVHALGKDPGQTAESIARGKAVYEKMECGKCHGAEGRGDGPSAQTLKDDWEHPIAARDLTLEPNRGGDTAEAINMRFHTGMDGTPMPTFSDNLDVQQSWDLAHFVHSLRMPNQPPPSDPVAYGRHVVKEKQCVACHVIEGKGGRVGPSLDVSAGKLRFEWAKSFLKNPREKGKIYPYITYRMPDLGLTDPEVEAVLALLAKISKRSYPEAPQAVVVDESKVAEGQLLYFLKCTECHNMGKVIPTPLAKQQGPDLINVSQRMLFQWIPLWIKSPQDVSPDTAMVDTNLDDLQIEAVRAFIWKTSVDTLAKNERPAK